MNRGIWALLLVTLLAGSAFGDAASRSRALNVGLAWQRTLPAADATIDAADRAQLGHSYFASSAAEAPAADKTRRKRN